MKSRRSAASPVQQEPRGQRPEAMPAAAQGCGLPRGQAQGAAGGREDVHLRRTRWQVGFCTLLPAPAALEPAPAPAFVHDSGPSAFTSEGQSALSSSAPVYSVGTKFKKRFPGYGVWTCTIAAIQEDGTYLGAYEDGTVKTYTANEIAKYLKQAEKLDAQEKRSAESPAQVGVGKTGQASAAKRLPAGTASSTSSPTCALPLRPPRPVASQASNAAQGTRPSSPSAGCSSIIELVEHASTRRNGSDSSAAQGGGRARRAMLASAPAPSYPPVGDTFEPGMVGLENLGNTAHERHATVTSILPQLYRPHAQTSAFPNRASVSCDHAAVPEKPKRKSRGGLHQNVPSERATLRLRQMQQVVTGG